MISLAAAKRIGKLVSDAAFLTAAAGCFVIVGYTVGRLLWVGFGDLLRAYN